MSVILYESGANIAGKKFQRIIKTFVPNEQIEICQSIEKLSERLRQPFYRRLIGVFIAADQQELSDLFSIRDLLHDFRFILVLPDNEKNTVTKGHSLGPRFLSNTDGNFRDVKAVLSKMLGINYSTRKTNDNYA